jgi:DNA replication protein DnaC
MSIESLPLLLKGLRLPSILASYESIALQARKNSWDYPEYLAELVDQEAQGRFRRRIARHIKEASLPLEKTFETLDEKKFPPNLRRALAQLEKGDFIGRAQNVLLFGNPGTGKTHVAAALSYKLIERGHRVIFAPAYALVQRLLAAKASLELDRYLDKLDKYDAIVLDDIGYIKQDRDEMEVLFTFFAQRYERKSLIITSNLVFSEWDKIFKDPMTTAAAIDRLVHHSTIIEMVGDSFRQQAAKDRKTAKNGVNNR